MATCKECLHNEACESMLRALGYNVTGDGDDADERCDTFKKATEYAEVVHERWIYNERWCEFECTRCGGGIGNRRTFAYCPHCGATMDGERRADT